MQRSGFFLGIVAVMLFVTLGCNKPSVKLVTVKGQVTLDGAPLTDAVVQFNGEDDTYNGKTNADGKYTLLCKAGAYKVVISKKPPGAKEQVDVTKITDPEERTRILTEQQSGDITGTAMEPPKELIPAKYSDVNKTQLEVKIPPGGKEDADFLSLTS